MDTFFTVMVILGMLFVCALLSRCDDDNDRFPPYKGWGI